MPTMVESLKAPVHDIAQALLDQHIPTRLADTLNGFVTAGFGVVGSVLAIVRDVTAPDGPGSTPSPTPSPSPGP